MCKIKNWQDYFIKIGRLFVWLILCKFYKNVYYKFSICFSFTFSEHIGGLWI